MSSDFDIDNLDIAPTVDQPPQSFDDGNLHCETCQTVLYYGGRGRKPRFCDEHKPGKTNQPKASSGDLRKIEAALVEMYQYVAMGVSMIDPMDGIIIAERSQTLAHSWILLAEKDPKIKKFLMKLTTGSGVGAVVIAHGSLAWAIAKNHDATPQLFTTKATA